MKLHSAVAYQILRPVVIGIGGRNIVQPVLVLVGGCESGILENLDRTDFPGGVRNANHARQPFQVLGRTALVPDSHLVLPIGNVADGDISIAIGKSKIWRIDRHHNRAHFGVNVAEKKANARAIESDRTLGACLIQAQVETPSIVEGKNIVKEGVFIGKFNYRSDRHDQNVWLEWLVPLPQLRGIWGA